MPTLQRAQDHPARAGSISRRDVLKALIASGVGATTGMGAYGLLYERHALSLTTADVPVRGLSPAMAGLRIGLLTDIHRSRWVSDADVRTAVRTLMSANPDLIVLGGDYVTWGDRRYVGPSAESLRGISAPHGVFAILGNHDDDHDMPSALRSQGIEVLKDARTALNVRNEILELAGIRFWTRRPSDVAQVLKGASPNVILLAHDPRRLSEAVPLGVPLVLSGHTHGGQVVLPVVGPIAGRKFPVVAGIGQEAQTTIFVSRGLGTVYLPVRVNCPPEVAILTLQRA